MESSNKDYQNTGKDLTFEDLQKRKLRIFDHPHLKEPCFALGLEQREQLQSCEVFKAFYSKIPKHVIYKSTVQIELDHLNNQTQAQAYNCKNETEFKTSVSSNDDISNSQIQGAGEPNFSSD